MKLKHAALLLAISLLILVILGSVAWTSRPTLIEFSPADGAVHVPVTTQIRLGFSRPMNAKSVLERLVFEPAIEGAYSWEGATLVFQPTQPLPSGKVIRLSLGAGAQAASWLAFAMPAESLQFTTADAMLAYLWPAGSPADLFVLNPLSGEIQQYTYGRDVLEYTASKDGMMLYFSAGNPQGGSDLYQIDRMAFSNPNNRDLSRKLLDCGAAQCRFPAVSVDKKFLAFEYILPSLQGGLGAAQIWILNLQDLERFLVGDAAHETLEPAWSSSGTLAYYDRTISAYVVSRPQASGGIELPNQTGQPGVWSPDGGFLLAPEISYHPAAGNTERGVSHLLRYDIQTGNPVDISGEGNVEDVEGVYSPDGKKIAFARKYLDEAHWTLGRQLWLMNADGTDPHPITAEADYNHYDLAWSGDGQLLAYVRFNQEKLSDPPELWMVNADGRDPIQLVIGGYSPIWIP